MGAPVRRVALAAAVIGGLASATYQAVGSVRDRRRHLPPGELIDIGGRRLHLWRAGEGSPRVVVVPALGAPALEWVRVQRALASDVEVCLYDRAGLGWSDAGPWPRTAGAMADELRRLLLAAGAAPPYVLVGHSLGGYIIRLYAARYRDSVAGMVLVDSSHEDQDRRLAPYERRSDREWLRALQYRLRPLGVTRAAVDSGINRRFRKEAARAVPPELVDARVALGLTTNHRRAVFQELLGFSAGAAEVRAEAGHLGELPLTVVTGGGREHLGQHWLTTWGEMQNDLTQLSERSNHVFAQHAGHHVHFDDPALVTEAIRGLLGRL